MLTVLDSQFRVLGQTRKRELTAFLHARGKKFHSEIMPELIIAVDALNDTDRPCTMELVRFNTWKENAAATHAAIQAQTAAVLNFSRSDLAQFSNSSGLETALLELLKEIGNCRLAYGPANHGPLWIAIIAPLIDRIPGEGCC